MTWNDIITNEQCKDYYKQMIPLLQEEYNNFECYPAKENIFKAFYSIPSPEDVKVVIIGQDPYHEPGQAMGLSFSVPDECKNPPSLQNIIKEVKEEYILNNEMTFHDCQLYHGDLTFWANQGVLLLNSTLTVRKGQANSHANIGWQTFTDNVIHEMSHMPQPMVFMLWGKFAQGKMKYIEQAPNKRVITCSHPSPFSANRGFFGSNCFLRCNEFLANNNIQPIRWLGVI